MADENRIHNITIKWTYPRVIENIDTCWESNQNGLYYVSRIFGRRETPIYIGETKRDFITRINEHYKAISNLFNKRGIKKIRLGIIVRPKSLSNYDDSEFKNLLRTIESRLIKYLNQKGHGGSLCNKRQVSSYTESFKLNIENIGYRGSLPGYLPYEE